MLNKYILGDKIIETTEERYNKSFKEMGYVPFVEKIKLSNEKVVDKSENEEFLLNEDKNKKVKKL